MMTSQTKELLQELFTATQILVNEGVLDGFGHVSVRSISDNSYFMIKENICAKFDENDFVELDLESNAIRSGGPRPSIERFIHGEIYKARPDIKAIVHTHSPALIPFGASSTPLQPLYHMCGFLHDGAPIFDIRKNHGITDLLVTSSLHGRSLAESLGNSSLVLMRGHGATVVGSSLKESVFRAVYSTKNAELQPVAMQLGEPYFLAKEEAILADELHKKVLDRPWNLWKSKLRKQKIFTGDDDMKTKAALIVGASKGLGLAIVQELLERGWQVTGTVRGTGETQLHRLAERFSEQLKIEHVDITSVDEIASLKSRLLGRSFDLLFVSAGVANAKGMRETIGEVSTEEFVRVMVTNSLSPMRVVEQLADLVSSGGTIGIMSSGQGSIADNESGGNDVYRASKAALNMVMRSFATRRGQDHALLLLAPGWIKTEMGGTDARFTVEETISDIVDTIVAQEGKTGLQYLDRFGKTVRW